jgi:glutamate--cysteine ligase
MYFVVRNGRYHDMTNFSFRQFMEGLAPNDLPDPRPTMGDFKNHLSTLFPEVRLKTYHEMRGADGGPWRRLVALPALWVGLLYDQASLDGAKDLIVDWTVEERQALRDAVPKTALATRFRNQTVLELGRQVIDLARQGLRRRAIAGNGSSDEAAYLGPMEETVALGRTPAENLIWQYETRWGRSVEPIFEEYAY